MPDTRLRVLCPLSREGREGAESAGVRHVPADARRKPDMTANPQDGIHRINIALQGGGAHGAFTWGVLDRLLEDGRLLIDGISGTSAGAMNAAVLAYGLARGGPPALVPLM
ncbi:MAG TPA: patatin-like phospholipase family protein, partial [Plasticicumulans sp.]|nr:patatin-like phospholipase family protein [Plasticicumulans sp.]